MKFSERFLVLALFKTKEEMANYWGFFQNFEKSYGRRTSKNSMKNSMPPKKLSRRFLIGKHFGSPAFSVALGF